MVSQQLSSPATARLSPYDDDCFEADAQACGGTPVAGPMQKVPSPDNS